MFGGILLILLLTLNTSSSMDWIGSMTSWKGFFTEFVVRKDQPSLVFTTDEDDKLWTQWTEDILLHVVKKTNIMFSTLPMEKTEINMGGKEDFYYNLTSLRFIRNVESPLYLVSSFRSKKDAIFISKVLSEYRFMSSSILLITNDDMINLVAQSYFPHSNQALLAKYGENNEIDIWETFQFDITSPSEFENVGRWKPSQNVKESLVLNEEDNVLRRQNLHGKTLRCLSLEYGPYTYVREENGQKIFEGLMIDVIDVIKKSCNFTYKCVEPPDGEWGAMRNNQWTGMVAETMKGNGDIVIAPLDHTPDRATVVDFTFAVREIGYRLVIRRPSQADVTWSSYVMELSSDSWLVFVSYLLMMWICLPFVTKVSPLEDTFFSYSEAFLLMIGSLSSNADVRPLRSVATRILIFTIYMTSFLVMSHYTAFLISSLAVTTSNLPFNTLQEMLQQDEYDFGIPAGISVEEMLKKTSNPVYQEVYRKFIEGKQDLLPKTFPEGIRKVKEDKFVFFTDYLNFKAGYGDDCEMIMLKKNYLSVPTAYAVQKQSPLLRIVNYHMQKIRETGLLNKLWSKWQPANFDCTVTTKTSLGLWNVMTAFMIMGFFMIVALALLVSERLQKKEKALPN